MSGITKTKYSLNQNFMDSPIGLARLWTMSKGVDHDFDR